MWQMIWGRRSSWSLSDAENDKNQSLSIFYINVFILISSTQESNRPTCIDSLSSSDSLPLSWPNLFLFSLLLFVVLTVFVKHQESQLQHLRSLWLCFAVSNLHVTENFSSSRQPTPMSPCAHLLPFHSLRCVGFTCTLLQLCVCVCSVCVCAQCVWGQWWHTCLLFHH